MKEAGEDYRLFKKYKSSQKRENRIVLAWQVILLAAFLAIWELAGRMDWIDPLRFSSPSQVITLLFENFSNGSMLMHFRTTLLATITGFIIGTISGILVASTLWSSLRFSNIMHPYLVVMKAMPKVALGPVIIVALGPGYAAIIAIGAIIPVTITTLVVFSGFRAVDDNYIKILKSFGASRGQIFKEAVFPATLPTMVATLKVNVGLSWVGIIVGEFLVSREGLGFLIINGIQVYDVTLVAASLLLIAISAVIMHKIIEQMEHWLVRDSD